MWDSSSVSHYGNGGGGSIRRSKTELIPPPILFSFVQEFRPFNQGKVPWRGGKRADVYPSSILPLILNMLVLTGSSTHKHWVGGIFLRLKVATVHGASTNSLKFRALREAALCNYQETMVGARFQPENPTVVSGSVNNINKTRPRVLLLSHHLGSSSISNTFTIRLPSRLIYVGEDTSGNRY